MTGDGNNGKNLSSSDVRTVVFAMVAIVAAVLFLDFVGQAVIPGYARTDSAIFGIIVGGVTSIIIGRAIWPKNGGNGV